MRKTVLIVDDSSTIRKLVTLVVRAMGHRAVTAADGLEALALMSSITVDLIITNLNMPNCDGYQLIRSIRKDYMNEEIPIIILSSDDDPMSIQKGYEVGANSYILKPFVPDVLQNEIRKYLQKSQTIL